MENLPFLVKISKIGCLPGQFPILGKNPENRVSRWKFSHFWPKSRKLGPLSKNFTIWAKIPEIRWLAGKFRILGKNLENRVFKWKITNFGQKSRK